MNKEKQIMPEQKPEERIKNFDEVSLGFSSDMAVLEAQRCLQCKNSPCVQGCPVNVNIPAFISKIRDEKFLDAYGIIKGTNSLPAVCGRVCPQESQCEERCVLRNKFGSVSIGKLERFVADHERNTENVLEIRDTEKTGKRVAVVGSGPAGLTAAGELISMGHDVTVFEALHSPGGVLVYGIPEFRLPKDIVHYEIDALVRAGVEIVTNRVIGISESLDDLLEKYDAVFIGTGAGLPSFLNIPGENLQGVYSANEYLTRINLMKAYMFPEYDTPVIRGRRVTVLGGGNVAMDSARTALRLGSEEVHLVYRRSMEEMPARTEEIHHAEEEGVIFDLLANPVEFLGDENGHLKSVRCIRMQLGAPDDSGRRRPTEVEGSEFEIETDVAIVAVGNGPNPIVQRSTPGMETSRRGNIVVDGRTMRTSKKGVFAGGDIVSGAATVIEAMGAGRNAASSIDEYLKTGQW